METKYQCFGPKTNYCHYYLDTPVSQILKTNDLPSVYINEKLKMQNERLFHSS